MSRINIYDVAKIFLSFDSMTHKKLQKLCYYAQAWHLALFKEPLLDEDFEAWVHGPVSPNLYQKYKNNGWEKIEQKNINKEYDLETMEFLEYIYNMYGDFSGDQLEHLTHEEDPWLEAREGLSERDSSNRIIKSKTMKKYYSNAFEN